MVIIINTKVLLSHDKYLIFMREENLGINNIYHERGEP
jgi:hypothetical protein